MLLNLSCGVIDVERWIGEIGDCGCCRGGGGSGSGIVRIEAEVLFDDALARILASV